MRSFSKIHSHPLIRLPTSLSIRPQKLHFIWASPPRPRTNWRGIVKKDLRGMGLTREEAEVAALNRQEWRQSVAQYVHVDVGWTKSSQVTPDRWCHPGRTVCPLVAPLVTTGVLIMCVYAASPYWRHGPPSDFTVDDEDDMDIDCRADGRPRPSTTWSINGTHVNC